MALLVVISGVTTVLHRGLGPASLIPLAFNGAAFLLVGAFSQAWHQTAVARRRSEHSFGVDLSGVRVHADAEADRLSRAVDATAFTTGRDSFFWAGAFHPGSSDGLCTLAHEATHVVQQAAE